MASKLFSAVKLGGNKPTQLKHRRGPLAPPPPRALEISEIPGIIDDYKHAAENALEAGFDGVELHAANGYLLEQFLLNGTNLRTDKYGGSPENRSRIVFETIETVLTVRDGLHGLPVPRREDVGLSELAETEPS